MTSLYCRECATDGTCVLCYECFKNSEHAKHKYKVCGDASICVPHSDSLSFMPATAADTATVEIRKHGRRTTRVACTRPKFSRATKTCTSPIINSADSVLQGSRAETPTHAGGEGAQPLVSDTPLRHQPPVLGEYRHSAELHRVISSVLASTDP